MPIFEKHFTPEEAQDLLPWVRGVIGKIHLTIHSVQLDAGIATTFDYPNPEEIRAEVAGPVNDNGGGATAPEVTGTDGEVRKALRLIAGLPKPDKRILFDELRRALLERGIVIQDIERGLIDFPAWKDGREVLLCYELTDGERITHWHEVQAGYAGRRKLEPDWR